MALTFVCMIGALAALEAASTDSSWTDQLVNVASMLICGGAGVWALRRYLWLLTHAERAANQADCPSCGTYARFQLVQADALGEQARVCCRQCGHHWTIEG
jgi:ABC-type nickel/cobalt efflux system permease component RcnA